jgi:hypothetical protein
VVELKQTDEAGSIADFGLKPGGRVRMIQTSSIQIKQSIHMARLEPKIFLRATQVLLSRDSIQAYDISCPFNDLDHLYVASNAVRLLRSLFGKDIFDEDRVIECSVSHDSIWRDGFTSETAHIFDFR